MNKPSLFAAVLGVGLAVSAPFLAVATLADELSKPLTLAALEKPAETVKAVEVSEFEAALDAKVKDATDAYTAKLDGDLSVKIAKDLIAKLKL